MVEELIVMFTFSCPRLIFFSRWCGLKSLIIVFIFWSKARWGVLCSPLARISNGSLARMGVRFRLLGPVATRGWHVAIAAFRVTKLYRGVVITTRTFRVLGFIKSQIRKKKQIFECLVL